MRCARRGTCTGAHHLPRAKHAFAALGRPARRPCSTFAHGLYLLDAGARALAKAPAILGGGALRVMAHAARSWARMGSE
jgi:hypothetical protein